VLTYLHPILAGTPLGCRIVEVDRLVDTFTAPRKQGDLPALVRPLTVDRDAMWRWMPIMSLSERLAQIPNPGSCPVSKLSEAIQQKQLQAPRFSDELTQALERFLTAREADRPGSTRIIRAALRCNGEQGEGLAGCLCSNVPGLASSSAYWMPEDHTSQFRERDEPLGLDMAWMKRSTDHLAHIDLWVHTTFALHHVQNDEPQVDEASALALDFPASELVSLRQVTLAQLPGYVARQLRSPSYDEFLAPVEDFVLLQRVMRGGLAGQLGSAFPVTKLLKLEADTRAYVAAQPTIKWEPEIAEKDFVDFLGKTDARARDSYLQWMRDMSARSAARLAVCDRVSK